MITKYRVFCLVIEIGSFTKAAKILGYSQSAVSQIVKSLERELGTILVNRGKDGIRLTSDGEQFLPYLQAIQVAENQLEKKQQELLGLEASTIRIGAFNSISKNFLPQLMGNFKKLYPKVSFELLQGETSSIGSWIINDRVDFGFLNHDCVDGVETRPIYHDEMLAVIPNEHKLTAENQVSLKELAQETLILLDEGEFSVALKAFSKKQLEPNIQYKIYDDSAILEMVQQQLGVSIMYSLTLSGVKDKVAVREIKEHPERTVALGWRNWQTMSFASRRFAEFILENIAKIYPEEIQGVRFVG